jgi:hypothetical protein
MFRRFALLGKTLNQSLDNIGTAERRYNNCYAFRLDRFFEKAHLLILLFNWEARSREMTWAASRAA